MTDTPVEYHRSRYDAPKKKGFMGVSIGVWIVVLIVVTILFGVLLYFVDKSRFELKIPDYTDDSVQVDLIDPIPPPPPPPPTDQPPPPKLQPREPAPSPMAPPVTLPIPPVPKEDRQEYTGPPVNIPGPPPPPAPPAPPRPSVITNPTWSRMPQPTERDFPDRALSTGTSGVATVRCTAQANGRPTNCQVVSESPSGYGFGRAAVRVVQRGELSPRTVDGAAENATFNVTIRFPIAN